MKFIFYFFITLTLFANERILYNASIYTMEKSHPWAEAIILRDDRIHFVGSTKEAMKQASKNGSFENQHGKFIMPGFIDSHTHSALGSLLANQGVNLIKVRGKNAILAAIKEYASRFPDEPVITGVGFYPYVFGPQGPSAKDLDQIIPNKPVFIVANNGHSAWCNTKAL